MADQLAPPADAGPCAVPRPAAATRRRRLLAGLGPLAGALLATLVAVRFDLPPAVPGIPVPGALVDYGLPIARALTDLAAAAMFGAGLVPLLAPGTPARQRAGLRLSLAAAVVLIAAALESVLLETANLWPGRPLDPGLLAAYVGAEPTGQALLATAGFGLVSLCGNWLSLYRPWVLPAELRLIIAGLAVLPLPLTGHGEDTLYHGLIMLSREAHVLAATAWTGGLFALAVLVFGHRPGLAVALPRFSTLATVALGTVGVTGIADALVELGSTPGVGLGGLWHSPYGLIALAKLACLMLLATLGGRIRFGLLPAVLAGRRVALFGWVGVELTVMGIAYGLAAVLANSPVVS